MVEQRAAKQALYDIYIYIYNKLRARVILSKSDSVKSWSVHVKDTVIKYTVNPTLDLCAHTSRP